MAQAGNCLPLVRVSPPLKRKLVSVRHICNIERIRDSSEVLVHLDGWQVVVPRRRPMYEVGDLVVYFEIDAFIPRTDPFWELFPDPAQVESFRGKQGYRVKSRRHRTKLSQGLIYPLDHFAAIKNQYETRMQAVGQEAATEELLAQAFADLLGVVKWEFTENAQNLPNLGKPPAFISLPGWHRIQDVAKEAFSSRKHKRTWQITEKLDGVTMTVYKIAKDSQWAQSLPALPAGSPPTMQDDKNRYGVCSRQADLIDREDSLYWQTAKKSGVLRELPGIDLLNVAVHGELCGSSIEGNTMNYPKGEHEFIVFGIWDIDRGRYLVPKRTLAICKGRGIKHAPVLGYTPLHRFASDLQELLQKAEGKGQFGGIREGLVFSALDGSEFFKVISNEWLIKTGK